MNAVLIPEAVKQVKGRVSTFDSQHEPIDKLMRRTLSMEEARAFWETQWESVLIRNQFEIPRLLERCPEVNSRVEVWQSVYREYGRGVSQGTYPALYRHFLAALGSEAWDVDTDAERFGLRRGSEAVNRAIAKLDQKGWLNVLAGVFLGEAVIVSETFGRIVENLVTSLKVNEGHLRFFTEQQQASRKTIEIASRLIARYARTSADHGVVRGALEQYIFASPYSVVLAHA
jgi:hypothetical protein